MSWARVLALVFIVSFTISALLSMLILDELEESAQSRRMGPRASASLVRHSLLPPTPQQLAFRARLHALHFGHQGASALVSRRAAGTKAGGDASDAVDPAAQRRFVEGYEQLMQSQQSRLSSSELERAMLQSAGLGFSAEGEYDGDFDFSEQLPELEEGFEGHDGGGESHGDGGDVSLLFGGGSSSLDGVSLWSLLWRGIGVDLASWDVDISNITHTWSKPNPPPQRTQLPADPAASQSSSAAAQPQADGSSMNAPASADAAAQPSEAATPVSPPPVAQRRSVRAARTVSVLHDLLPHQGVQPYVSLTDNCSTVQLALVHSYFNAAAAGRNSAHDSRGDGLVEWFTRSARPFLYPVQSVAGAAIAAAAAAKEQLLTDPTLPQAVEYLTGFAVEPWLVMADPWLSLLDLGLDAGFGGNAVAGGHGNTPRRQSVDGDWALHEYARVPGVVHASASTNAAGGSAEEEDWLVVAYEAEDPDHPDAETGSVELLVFFQPNSTAPQAGEDAPQQHDDFPAQSQAVPGVACEGASSRVCLTIRLPTLRVITAMHVSSTRLDESSDGDVVPLTILYALRGDRRVFRSVEVRATRSPLTGKWALQHSHAAAGPLADRRGFISQTVSLQSYQPITNGSAAVRPLSTGVQGDLSVSPAKVVAAELNWARGPVTLAGAHASSSYNKWGVEKPAGTRQQQRNAKQALYLQSTPPYSAAVYARDRAAPSSDEQPTNAPSVNQSAPWQRESWISSKKTEGKYGVDVHPLSIHRGNEGTLTPLVTAASANQRFVAFAQVPLITTVDGNENYEPIEIIHLDADTAFTGLAFNNDGTILAISDNHQDVIILRRSADSANAKQAVVAASTKAAGAPSPVAAASAPNAMAESNVTEANETKSEAQAAGLSDTASNGGAAAPDAAEAPAQPPPSKPSKPAAPAAAARRRHSWEVMMEVVLPPKLRKLPMLSMQIVDMPVPAELLAPARRPQPGKQKAGQDAPAATEASPATNVTAVQPSAPVTTPVMVMLFQGGVLAALQLTVIGANTAAPPPSTLASHFNHPPLSAQFNLDMLRSFLHVHWDLVLILFIGTVWVLFSVPRFNRIAAQAQQAGQPQRPMAVQLQGGARPRGFLGQMIFGDAAIQFNAQFHNVVAAAAAVPPPPPAPPAVPMPNLLNPLAHVAPPAARPPVPSPAANVAAASSAPTSTPASASAPAAAGAPAAAPTADAASSSSHPAASASSPAAADSIANSS